MAVTFDFGKCAACGESNSKSLSVCRACGAALPWAKPGSQNSMAPPSPGGAPKPKIGLGDLAYGAMAVQLLGGLIFVAGAFFWLGNVLRFFPTFPGLGYISMLIGGALWGFGQNMGVKNRFVAAPQGAFGKRMGPTTRVSRRGYKPTSTRLPP